MPYESKYSRLRMKEYRLMACHLHGHDLRCDTADIFGHWYTPDYGIKFAGSVNVPTCEVNSIFCCAERVNLSFFFFRNEAVPMCAIIQLRYCWYRFFFRVEYSSSVFDKSFCRLTAHSCLPIRLRREDHEQVDRRPSPLISLKTDVAFALCLKSYHVEMERSRSTCNSALNETEKVHPSDHFDESHWTIGQIFKRNTNRTVGKREFTFKLPRYNVEPILQSSIFTKIYITMPTCHWDIAPQCREISKLTLKSRIINVLIERFYL